MRSLREHLKGVKGTDETYTALCPSHGDRANSLSVGTGADGRQLVKCHAGCSAQAVVEAVGLTLADLMPDKDKRTLVATYDYQAADGTLLYQALRYEPKTFRQRRPDGAGGWVWNLAGVDRVVYRLPFLRGQASIWVTEGEKDADKLAALGLASSTTNGGAKGWHDRYAEQWQQAGVETVWLLPDNDPPGRDYMAAIAASCRARGLQAFTVTLPDVPAGGDVSDYLERHTVDDLRVLASQASRVMDPLADMAGLPEAVTEGLTEAAHAERFAQAYGHELRYDHRRGIWVMYRDGRWRLDPTETARNWGIQFARSRQREAAEETDIDKKARALKFLVHAESQSGVDRLMNLSRIFPPLNDPGTEWDQNLWLLGTPNGLIDLRTGTHRAGDPADRMTFATSVPFDAAATCPRWIEFLSEVFDGDARLSEFFQRFIGYSLSGDTTEQILVICYGKGANGKSTALNTLRKVLGDYAANLPFSSLEYRGASAGIPNDLAALAGRRLVLSAETVEGAKLHEGRIKALTGGDPITARFLHGEWFTFEPQAKFLLSVNHKPVVTDDSVAMWRRIRLLPFTRSFTGSACDATLPKRLLSEGPGILNWAIQGCVNWQAHGLNAPEPVMAATREYEAESDALADFIDERLEIDPEAEMRSSDIQTLYLKWADQERIPKRERLSARALGLKLIDKFTRTKRRDGAWYGGVKARSDKLW